ncbi:MAG TPA: galactokinase [Candidatus Aminicenantes bacterium]|nr:galactokinase [Candidatus Aminicenantes bacterium]HRY65910.1 galactokinase [Candidatus Aminicenantes bacterium]HRZ72764.1 galactokinase [Candidatus Aminicenantes bacterium]
MNALVPVIADRFRRQFPGKPLLVVSPGRVNLIGEHTDYNEGFVMPGATDKAVVFAVAPRADGLCHFVSRDFDQEFRCEIGGFHRSPLRWPDYLQGVLDQFVKAGRRIGGISCVFGGDIPIGAGMSSSAAIEGGLAFALDSLFGLGLSKLDLVRLAQKAENEFVGVRCGIMDQFINIHGREKSVLKLDCRSLTFDYLPFEREDLRVVIADTLVRRELASSEYNVRRGQCEAGVAALRAHEPALRSLRDVTLDMLRDHRAELDPVVYRRCEYVVRENIRVGEAAVALARNDFAVFGGLMNLSHAGLRDDYQVSSPELDALVEAARRVPGVLGSRMMGAGFGGCTISLVEAGAVPEFEARVARDYEAAAGKAPKIHVVRIEAGTHAAELA